MEPSDLSSTKVNAQFSIKPELSQSVLITTLLISVIPLSVGMYFLWHEKPFSWLPFLIFFFLLVLVSLGWWRSQKSIDMGNSSPTKISDKHGNQVLTDTRVLESTNAVKQLGVLLQSIGVRNPLPESDGIIGTDGAPIPDSKSEAASRINSINSKLETATQGFINMVVNDQVEAVQEIKNPPEESCQDILEHNRVEDVSKT